METTFSNMNLKILFPTYSAKLMRCDFVIRIERAQMFPIPRLDAYVCEEATPLRMVTGVVPTTTSPTPKSKQRSMIYDDKEY